MFKKLIVTGAIEAIVLTVAALLKPQFLVDHAVWVILAAAAALVVVAWYDAAKKAPGSGGGVGGNSATTSGDMSPAFAGNEFHNATLNFGTAAPEPKLTARERAHKDAATKCPPMRIAHALRYLMAIGYSREDSRLALQQAFKGGSVVVWGRLEVPATTFQAPRVPQETWSRLPADYWSEFRLTEEAFSEHEGLPQTEAYAHVRKDLMRTCWSLRVSEAEIRLEWPPRRSDGDYDDGVSWKTV